MNLLRKLLKQLRALLPKLRIVWDYSEVDAILRDRDWQMAGPVQRMLGPLLGEGVIMATGKAHTDLRRPVGVITQRLASVSGVLQRKAL